jgi:hypothetical protein
MKQEKFVSSESSEEYQDSKINEKPKTSDLFADSDSD